MTCKLCRGLGVVYGNPLTGTVCPACGGTGIARTAVGAGGTGMARAAVSTPAEKTLLDEFAMAAMSAIVLNNRHNETEVPFCGVVSKISALSYKVAAAMMKERNRRDEMGSVKEAND